MKFNIDMEVLKKAIINAQAMTDDSLVLISSSNNTLHVESASYGVYLRQDIPTNIVEDGSFAILGSSISSVQVNGEINVEIKGNKFKFKASGIKGSFDTNQKAEKIINLRPDFGSPTCSSSISRDVLALALKRTSFISNIANAQVGLRFHIDQGFLSLSSTDNFRATYCKLPIDTNDNMDFVIRPGLLNLLVNRFQDQNVVVALYGGIMMVSGPNWWFYHPTVQSEIEDIGEWLNEGIASKTILGKWTTSLKELSNHIRSVSSVIMGAHGSIDHDMKMKITLKGKDIQFKMSCANGKSEGTHSTSSFEIIANPCESVVKYSQFFEMLGLFSGEDSIIIEMYDDFLILRSSSSSSVIPTVTM